MKTFKRFTALVLALVMAAMLAVSAYAATVVVKYKVYVYTSQLTFKQYDYSSSTTPSTRNLTILADSSLGSGSALYHVKYVDGALAYCIQPGVRSDDSSNYVQGSSGCWYNLPASVQSGIALVLACGYPSAEYGTAYGDSNSSDIIGAEKWAATQAVIWDLICEYRSPYDYRSWGSSPFYNCVDTSRYPTFALWYSEIVDAMQSATDIPSFAATSSRWCDTIELTKDASGNYSYEAQKNYYTDKIVENKSWTMADIFADEGTTGTSVKKRADFMRMMKWCKQGKIDLILTKSVSRFARNTVDCLNYVRMLKAQGIAVYFEKENINSMDESTELMLTMMGAFAQAESESISGNIQAGKRYAMQRGEATINYYNLYAYEKGPDGNPQIIPEQAEIVREIYQKYLHGDSLNMIRKDLEERHIPNARGGATWTHTAVRGILSNEKYAGDVLMQKTFQQDCISHKTIRNTGQRTMYLVPDHHEAIIDRKTYNAVQTELARRNALKGNTQKSTPSGRSCYTPKYALSDRLICGECGTLYRRCTWVNRGKKHIVWRCISRFDYGKKYCHDSPSVDEQQLQQAILRAINSIMSEKPALVRQVTENLQVVIHPNRSGELTIAEIDHQLESLAQEFDAAFITVASGNSTDYMDRFKAILSQQAELKAKRVELERQQAEDAELTSHMGEAAGIMEQAGTVITEWNERNIRDLVASVRILSKEEILVRLKSGIEVKERLV